MIGLILYYYITYFICGPCKIVFLLKKKTTTTKKQGILQVSYLMGPEAQVGRGDLDEKIIYKNLICEKMFI